MGFWMEMSAIYPLAQIGVYLRQYLQQQTQPVTEYALIKILDAQGVFTSANALSASLRLFHQHFVTTHCLYCLQKELYPQYLEINPLSIRLHAQPMSLPESSALMDDVDQLRRFYLDVTHLNNATEASVEQLQAQFWRISKTPVAVDEAYAQLGLEPAASWSDIKRVYRQQVQRAHPDKGGDAQRFDRLYQAYQILKRQRVLNLR
jgi:hypothetical protein